MHDGSGGSRWALVVSTETPFEILCTELSNLITLIEQSNQDFLIEWLHADAITDTLLQ